MAEALFDNDNIRQFHPEFARLVGINVAIVAQQVHHWIKVNEQAQKNDHFFNGRWWVYNTYNSWKKDFSWWSKATIERTFRQAREWGILVAEPIYIGNEIVNMWWSVDRQRCNEILRAGKKLNKKNTSHQIEVASQIDVRSHQIDVLTEITTKTTEKDSLRYAVESEKLPAYLHNVESAPRNANGEVLPTYTKGAFRKTFLEIERASGGKENFIRRHNQLWGLFVRILSIAQEHPDWTPEQIDAEMTRQDKAAQAQRVSGEQKAVGRNDNKAQLEAAIRIAWGWVEDTTDATTKRVRKVANALNKVGCLPEYIPLLHKHCHDHLTQFTVNAYETQYDVWKSKNGRKVIHFTPEQLQPTQATLNANDFVVTDDDGTWIGRGMEAQKELERRRDARRGEVA